jgi:hypothetical protein
MLNHSVTDSSQLRLKGANVWRSLLVVCVGIFNTGCGGVFIHSNSHHHDISLASEQLYAEKFAFITPSTITGQEEDKQALALIFTEALAQMYPDIHYISLAETLSAVNKAGLTDEYRQMYEHYRYTGIFKRSTLQKIGQVSGARYVVQLKLAGFEQGTEGRFGLLGWRIVDTKFAKIRLFVQVWDTAEGAIVWEATHEMNYAYDTIQETNVTFRNIVNVSAQEVLQLLPKRQQADSGAETASKNLSLQSVPSLPK